MKRRVVITGLGTINAIGNNTSQTWENAIKGTNGIGAITLFDASNQKQYLVGEVKDFHPEEHLPPKEAKRLDRTMAFALVASSEAVLDSKIDLDLIDHDRFGVFVTSGMGGFQTLNEEIRKAYLQSVDRMSPFFVLNSIINLVSGNIAIKFQAKGATLAVVTACSSATNAIGEAYRYIKDGYLDYILAGGAEAPINAVGIGGFASMKAISPSLDPERASIPYDLERSGFVMAEGAGVLMLEEYEQALKRNARIYSEIIGYAANCDAYHVTQPDEAATGIIKCMRLALNEAQLDPGKVDYISPHGTATYYNDRIESKGIREVFGPHAYDISISATKSMHAHALGAAGGIETVIACKALESGIIPPTINYRVKDPECDLDYTPNIAKERSVHYCLKNSLGFGGHNATLILKKWENDNA